MIITVCGCVYAVCQEDRPFGSTVRDRCSEFVGCMFWVSK
jgi:hypothetical protein